MKLNVRMKMIIIKKIFQTLKELLRKHNIIKTPVNNLIRESNSVDAVNSIKNDDTNKLDVMKESCFLPTHLIPALIEEAINFEKKQNDEEAIKVLTKIIEYSVSGNPYIPLSLNLRHSIYSKLGKWDLAIADILTSIELEPDAESNYLSLGVLKTWKLFYSKNYRIDDNNEVLEEVINYYKECLQRNPMNTVAWLNIVETYIFLQKWDDAISYYGLCCSYMDNGEHKLIRAWLGALSLALAGDPIEDEDMKLLLDQSIKYETRHDTNQIRDVLLELERIEFDNDRLEKAKYIHGLYMNRIKSIND